MLQDYSAQFLSGRISVEVASPRLFHRAWLLQETATAYQLSLCMCLFLVEEISGPEGSLNHIARLELGFLIGQEANRTIGAFANDGYRCPTGARLNERAIAADALLLRHRFDPRVCTHRFDDRFLQLFEQLRFSRIVKLLQLVTKISFILLELG